MEMRNYLLLCVCAWVSVTGFAQQSERQRQNQRSTETQQNDNEKSSYISVSGTVGSSGFNYKLNSLNEKGDRSSKLGYGIEVKYSYFFNQHWGVATGFGFSRYETAGKLAGSMTDASYYSLGSFVDNDEAGRPRDFELRTRINNLEEKQTAFMLEVPIMGMYQTRFGEEEKWGIYGGLGVKLQFPVNTKFKIQKGENSQFNVSGYYAGIPTDMGSPSNPPVPQHGYGTITNPNASLDWDDKSKMKMSIAGTAEFGFLVDLGKDMDLMLGGYIDYGFTDMKKNGNQGLFTAPAAYHPATYEDKTPYIGKGITYNGMLNSNVTDKINAISFGGKIGLRFKL